MPGVVISPPSAGSGSASRRATQLTARGLIEETFQFPANGQNVLVLSWVQGMLLGLTAGDIVTNIVAHVVTAGAGTAPTTMRLGLADKTGKILGRTANVNSDAKWLSAGNQSFALGSPVTIPATDGYYAVAVQDTAFGTTNPQLAIVALQNTEQGAVGSGAALVAGQNVADLPAVNSSLTLTTNNGNLKAFWFGVS